MLRQVDVIEKWRPANEKAAAMASFRKGKSYWKGELTFENVTDDGLIIIHPTKTRGARVEFDLKLYPLVQKCLALIPEGQKTGPFVLNDRGLPPDRWEVFRDVAPNSGRERYPEIDAEHGQPRQRGHRSAIRRRRVGGRFTPRHATHASVETTRRIYDRSNLEVTSRVQKIRSSSRKS